MAVGFNPAISNPLPRVVRADQGDTAARRVSPEVIGQLVARYAAQNGSDPIVLLAVIDVESGFNNLAVGDGGTSFGLFQHHIGGAGGATREQARRFLNAETAIEERSRAFAGVRDGAGAAAVQRPANRAAYARKVDERIAKMRRATQGAGSGSGSGGGAGGGAKSAPLRDEIRRIATAPVNRGGFGLKHTSGDRARRTTSSGNVSDHWQGQTTSWADDYAGPMDRMHAFERYLSSRGDMKQVLGPLSDPKGHGDHVHAAGFSAPGGGSGMVRTGLGTSIGSLPGVSGAMGKALRGALGAAGGAASGAASSAGDAIAGVATDAVDGVAGAISSAVDTVVRSGAILLVVALGGLLVIIGVTRATGATARATA